MDFGSLGYTVGHVQEVEIALLCTCSVGHCCCKGVLTVGKRIVASTNGVVVEGGCGKCFLICAFGGEACRHSTLAGADDCAVVLCTHIQYCYAIVDAISSSAVSLLEGNDGRCCRCLAVGHGVYIHVAASIITCKIQFTIVDVAGATHIVACASAMVGSFKHNCWSS